MHTPRRLVALRERRPSAWACVATLALGCGPAPPGGVGPAPDGACSLGPPTSDGAGVERTASLRVAWQRDPDWTGRGGPFEAAADRFMASVRTESLVWVDCEGHLRPAVARAWTSDVDGRTWTFTFTDQVARAGAGRAIETSLARDTGMWSALAPVSLEDGGVSLRIGLGQPVSSGRPFADPRILALEVLRPVDAAAVRGIRFPIGDGPEPVSWGEIRDAVDDRADLAVTRAADVVRYGEATGAYHTTPLAWDRLHLLVTPAAAGAGLGEPTSEMLDLVAAGLRADTRPAGLPSWMRDSCGARPTAFSEEPTGTDGRIAYLAGDPLGADLASRLVALGLRDAGLLRELGLEAPGRAWAAVPLEAVELRARLRSRAGPSLVSAPRRPLTPCEARTTWDALVPSTSHVVPLVESRAHALIRSGAAVAGHRTGDGLVRLELGGTGS